MNQGMTKTVLLIMGGVLLLASQSTAFHPVQEEQFTFDGRTVRVVAPEQVLTRPPHSQAKVPLIIAMAGLGPEGSAILAAGFGDLPKTHKVIVAAPNGSIHPRLQRFFWNATLACCGFPYIDPEVNEIDDVDFLTRLTDDLADHYPVDERRIYVVGHSNGGYMAHRLACDAPERYAAFVSMAGATHNDPSECNPMQPVSMLQVHGTADTQTRFEGGNTLPDGNPLATYPGALTTVATWADKSGCTGELEPHGGPLDLVPQIDGNETDRWRYRGCRGVTVELWQINGGGHLWFLPLPTESQTAEEVWDWLKIHRRYTR
jgi:polyhydroxybutyrate depolymerase